MSRSRKSEDSGAWALDSIERPWTGDTSIHAHISNHLAPDGKGLVEGGERLPDERDDGELRWVAGGLDGAFGHHGHPGSETSRARMLYRALGVVLEDANPVKLKRLYDLLTQDGVLEYIDPLLERILDEQELNAERLGELALFIATHAPDREPVKVAIALLGILSGTEHSDLLMTLGRHEEFTLFAAVALSNTEGAAAEHKLFTLARQVDGWGRIQLVERLAETDDPAIKAWMLREGYKNAVMYEYLAYTCAMAGGLRDALAQDAVDPELLAGAGELIQALITGGPAEDMDDYEDGAFVVKRYLHHLGEQPRSLDQLITADYIQRYLDYEDSDWKTREQHGWTPAVRAALQANVQALKELPHWPELVDAGLTSGDTLAFRVADRAASALGIDTWEHHFARLRSGDPTGNDDSWYFAMQTDDPDRIDRIVALAENLLPLAELGSGPAEEMGLGPQWTNHGHLDMLLQDLRRFPGKGWPLIRAGIRSPVIRNRHMALKALAAWDRGTWPAGAHGLLETAVQEEPDEEVRARLEALLAPADSSDSGL